MYLIPYNEEKYETIVNIDLNGHTCIMKELIIDTTTMSTRFNQQNMQTDLNLIYRHNDVL